MCSWSVSTFSHRHFGCSRESGFVAVVAAVVVVAAAAAAAVVASVHDRIYHLHIVAVTAAVVAAAVTDYGMPADDHAAQYWCETDRDAPW